MFGELTKALDNTGHKINIISGPTAVGKGTVSKILAEKFDDIFLSISTTTRNVRKNETPGIDYNYVTCDNFEEKIKNGDFLEYAKVHNSYYYATPVQPLIENLKNNKRLILEIDIQGARYIRNFFPKSNFIFLTPPNFETLIERQKIRDTENYEERQIRLNTAKIEMKVANEFDYNIVNDKLDLTVEILNSIIV